MKKIMMVLLATLLCMPTTAQAAKRSFPKLMLSAYTLSGGSIEAGMSMTLSVTITNTSAWQSAQNVSLQFTESSGKLIPKGIGNTFTEEIKPAESFVWDLPLMVLPDTAPGHYKAEITISYEDSRQIQGNTEETLYLEVTQPVRLEYVPVSLPDRIVEGDRVNLTLELRNLGKGTLYNTSVVWHIPGLASGISAFAGNLDPGSAADATVSLQAYRPENGFGAVNGYGEILYEDAAGKLYRSKIELSTTIEEYIPPQSPVPKEKKEEQSLSLPLIPIVGAMVSTSVLFIIIQVIYVLRKRRREEDKGL